MVGAAPQALFRRCRNSRCGAGDHYGVLQQTVKSGAQGRDGRSLMLSHRLRLELSCRVVTPMCQSVGVMVACTRGAGATWATSFN